MVQEENSWPIFSVDIHQQDPFILNTSPTQRALSESVSSVPLRRGYGTHIAYLWIGTPPKRVSVIVDTGSHHLAFPCSGCKDCGHHIDPYFDPQESISATIDNCFTGAMCSLEQSYTEGSTWRAFTLTDLVCLGGETAWPFGNKTMVRLRFGCQSAVTGLFRTQLANGIMGLSGFEGTLPNVLYRKNMTMAETLALCFHQRGGSMTIGGVDTRLISDDEDKYTRGNVFAVEYKVQAVTGALSAANVVSGSGSSKSLVWAKLLRRRGWYTVQVLGVSMTTTRMNSDNSIPLRDIGATVRELNTGKGAILDSGTTDTFLPESIAMKFKRTFKEITGLTFRNRIILTHEQRASLPDVVIRLKGFTVSDFDNHGSQNTRAINPQSPDFYNRTVYAIDAVISSTDYLHHVKGDVYALNIYLTEPEGLVLGANFMNEKYIVFDRNSRRVGFSSSRCVSSKTSVNFSSSNLNLLPKKYLRGNVNDIHSLNTSEVAYWRLIGWRKTASTSDINSLIDKADKNEFVSSRRLTVQKKILFRNHVLEFCRRKYGYVGADKGSNQRIVISATPTRPCSATCGNARGSAAQRPAVYFYDVTGRQEWHCVVQSNKTNSAATTHTLYKVLLRCGTSCFREGDIHKRVQKYCLSNQRDFPLGDYSMHDGVSVQQGHWGSCNSSCLQHRISNVPYTNFLENTVIVPKIQVRECFSSHCPSFLTSSKNESILIRFQICNRDNAALIIEFARLEDLAEATASLLQVPGGLLVASLSSREVLPRVFRGDQRCLEPNLQSNCFQIYIRFYMLPQHRYLFLSHKFNNHDTYNLTDIEFVRFVYAAITERVFARSFKSGILGQLLKTRGVRIELPSDKTDDYINETWLSVSYWNWLKPSSVHVSVVSDKYYPFEMPVRNSWAESITTYVLGNDLGSDFMRSESLVALGYSLFILVLSIGAIIFLRCFTVVRLPR